MAEIKHQLLHCLSLTGTVISLQEIDVNNEGWVFPKDFKEKMEQQKSYTP